MKRVFPGALATLALTCISLLAGGCRNSMYEENSALHGQNRLLQSHLSATKDELSSRPTPAQVASLEQQVAERDRMIEELKAQLSAPGADGEQIPGIEGVDVSVTREGNLSMSVAGDVLFASGSTTINKTAEATLAKIADVLKQNYGAKAIRVEGHTDTDPISKTKNLYADNRDLSLKRAYSVTKFLETRGVQPERMETVGHGQYKPRSSNKKDNRRVEIIVLM